MSTGRSRPCPATALPPGGLPTLRTWSVCAAVICAFFSAGSAFLAAAESTAPSSSAAVSRDLRLTLQARKALVQDKSLAGLNLGVSVRGGVATLYGTVPTPDVARRAEERLRQLAGLTDVRNQLRAEPARGSASTPSPPSRSPVAAGPPEAPAESPGLLWRPGEGSAPKRLTQVPAAELYNSLTQPTTLAILGDVPPLPHREGPPGVSLLPPMPLPAEAGNPPRSAPAALPTSTAARGTDLAQVVEALRQGSDRWRRIEPEVRGGVVYLRGTVYRWEDLFELARQIARQPGVERVILQDIRTAAVAARAGWTR